jgi:eukaryotic-like serine/threonine-protein kinase
MQVRCPHCQHQLELMGLAPASCVACGRALAGGPPISTAEYDAGAATLPPDRPTVTETHIPAISAGAAAAEASELVGNYRLLRRLGGGGMGDVYEAEEITSSRRVALKLVQAEYAASEEAVERFRQEGELASRLSHPRCVFVLAADQQEGRPYIVMELMTGETLNDLVKDNGPLPVETAIRKILDVIDGLEEAHRLGLVHRDVKPSNCFLEADGRVKIGDFGLAKSLLSEAHLTKTGTFLGTPLFAAPEQIKRETVDAQSDVYSVEATLYFLLTGQAPFQTGDAMASMARIVSDAAPSMRTLRPELPKALDKAVLRGLERERKRRWRSLEDLRRALLRFLPVEPSIGGLGLRLIASLVDQIVLGAVISGITAMLAQFTLSGGNKLGMVIVQLLLVAAIDITYFGVLEGLWGCSLGKRLLRLRVGGPTSAQPPGLQRAFLRAGVLYVTLNLGTWVGQGLLVAYSPEVLVSGTGKTAPPGVAVAIGLGQAYLLLALALILSTGRKRNGYRCLHEILSCTRTYSLRWTPPPRRRRLVALPYVVPVMESADLPAQVGPYKVRGLIGSTSEERTVLADDVQLHRAIWLWLRPATAPALDPAQRSTGRETRLRWLACGAQDGWQWDAFLAPTGCPLSALVARGEGLSWAEFRPLLEDLTDEILASGADRLRSSAVGRVWVSGKGQVQLVDVPLTSSLVEGTGEPKGTRPAAPAALDFLCEVAVLGLEGKPLASDAAVRPPELPLPVHAAEILSRLACAAPGAHPDEERLSVAVPYADLAQFRAALTATQAEPRELTRRVRAWQILTEGICIFVEGLVGVLLGWVLTAFLVSPLIGRAVGEEGETTSIVICAAVVLLLVTCMTRGGLSFLGAGIRVARTDGRRASRLRCAWRTLLAGASLGVVGGLSYLGLFAGFLLLRQSLALALALWATPAVLLGFYGWLLLRDPSWSPHDHVAGTRLVPQ